MSNIYEALLRAEQDRAAGKTAPPADHEKVAVATSRKEATAVEEQVEAPAVVEQGYVIEPGSHAAVFVSAPAIQAPVAAKPAGQVPKPVAPVMPAAKVAPTPREVFDASKVRTTVWKPLLDKLPALEERGNAVEQFRSLRTRIFGFRDLNTLKSILVSSGLPREGKSFIAANLAISFARHKASRVLLIDGDMRRSSLHNLFGCEESPGLTNYLAGQVGINEIMQRAALKEDGSPLFAGLGSLTFIGGGEEGDKAADLSGSGRFRQLIEAATPHFDWIVVDSSPVNLVTDGVNLANACDAVLMVARGGVTKFEAAQRALAELKASKILGFVLNAVDTQPMTDGYYGYDGYDTAKNPPGPATQ